MVVADGHISSATTMMTKTLHLTMATLHPHWQMKWLNPVSGPDYKLTLGTQKRMPDKPTGVQYLSNDMWHTDYSYSMVLDKYLKTESYYV